jgi:hypothetical protein
MDDSTMESDISNIKSSATKRKRTNSDQSNDAKKISYQNNYLQLQEESKKWNSVFIKLVLDFLSFQELYLIQMQKQLFLENQKFTEYYY